MIANTQPMPAMELMAALDVLDQILEYPEKAQKDALKALRTVVTVCRALAAEHWTPVSKMEPAEGEVVEICKITPLEAQLAKYMPSHNPFYPWQLVDFPDEDTPTGTFIREDSAVTHWRPAAKKEAAKDE